MLTHYSGSTENRLFLGRARKQAAQYTADGVETQKLTVFDGRTLTHSVKKITITIAGKIAPALKAAFRRARGRLPERRKGGFVSRTRTTVYYPPAVAEDARRHELRSAPAQDAMRCGEEPQ
jgi:hypothetical protein